MPFGQDRTLLDGQARIQIAVEVRTRRLAVPCIHEEVAIERRPVQHGAAAPIGGDGTAIIRLSRERPLVAKPTVETEAIVLGRRAVPSLEQLANGVRHEEPRVLFDDAGDVR